MLTTSCPSPARLEGRSRETSNYDIDFVLRYAEQDVFGGQFARAVATHNANLATLNAYPMPEEARQAIEEIRQAFEIAVVEAFGLAQNGGWELAGRWARIERTLKATSVRVKDQLPAIEARRKQVRAFCDKRKWRYDMPELAGRLAGDLGDLEGKERTRATLRKLYARDLAKLARDTTT